MANTQLSVSPGTKWVSITPADTALANGPCRMIYVGGAGNLSIVDRDGTTVVFTAITTGIIHPISAVQIKAATTATLILAGY